MACAAGSSGDMEDVKPSTSMSEQQQQQQQQQQQCGLGVKRRRWATKRLLEADIFIDIEENNLECQECGKTFTCKSHLKLHSVTHSRVRKYKCRVCEKRFLLKGHLTDHSFIHSGVKKHECDQCGKRFIQKSLLTQHSRKHSDINYKFDTHKKRFTRRSSPTTARLVRNYECDVCMKIFTQKGHLTDHSFIHSGVKNHECDQCGKRFIQKSALNQHSRKHSDVINYKFNKRRKRFSQRSAVAKQRLTHCSGGETRQCHLCGETFRLTPQLDQHILKTHTVIHTL